MNRRNLKKLLCLFICTVMTLHSFVITEEINAENSGILFSNDTQIINITSISQINSSGNYRLLQNDYLKNTFEVDSKWNVSLDLNGYQVTVKKNGARSLYAINNYGTFTLEDSSQSKTGAIIARGIQNFGTMFLKNGTVIACDDGGGGAAIWNEGTFTMTDGMLKVTGTPIDNNSAVPINVLENASATITGGTLSSKWINIMSYGSLSIANLSLSTSSSYWNCLKIMDGVANITNVKINAISGGGLEVAGGVANLYNCSFTQTEYFDHNSMNLAVSNEGILNIYSGTYTSENYGIYIFSSGGTINSYGGTFKAGKEVLKADGNSSDTFQIKIFDGSYDGEVEITEIVDMLIEKGNFINSSLSLNTIQSYLSSKSSVIENNNDYRVYHTANEILLSNKDLTLIKGSNQTITAKVLPTDSLDDVTWSSSDENIVTIDKNGHLIAQNIGKAVIQAVAGKIVATCTVNVYDLEKPTLPDLKPSDSINDIYATIDEKTRNTILDETKFITEDILYNRTTNAISSETEKKLRNAIKNGKTISSEVTIEMVDKDVIENYIYDAINDIKPKNSIIAQYLDLNVALKADDTVLGYINNFTKNLTFTITIPESYIKDGRSFHIIRYHDGRVDTLSTTLTKANELSFETDKLSIYALAYTDQNTIKPIPLPNPPATITPPSSKKEVKTGENERLYLYVAMMFAGIDIVCIVLVLRKRQTSTSIK